MANDQGEYIPIYEGTDSLVLVENYYKPDFSDFSAPPVNWNISYGFESEVYFNLSFAGLPKYKGLLIALRDQIVIPVQGLKLPIKMYVRAINYKLDNNSKYTEVTLKTNMENLDTLALKPISASSKNIEDLFTKIANVLKLKSKYFSSSNITLNALPITGSDEIILDSTTTVLDFLHRLLGFRTGKTGKTIRNPVINWWFDIYDQWRAENYLTENLPHKQIDYNYIKPAFISLNININDKREKQKVRIPYAIYDGVNTESGAPNQADINEENLTTGITKAENQSKNAGGRPGNQENLIGYNNLPINAYSASLKIKGFHWLDEHSLVELKNFDLGNDLYVVEGVSIYHSFNSAHTEVKLKGFIEHIPNSIPDSESLPDGNGQPNQAQINEQNTTTSVVRQAEN